MTLDEFTWEAPPLSSEDDVLIQAYQDIGLPLDSLAYTDHFGRLVELAGEDPQDNAAMRTIFRRLLGLRKRGMLPRLYSRPASSPPPTEKAG